MNRALPGKTKSSRKRMVVNSHVMCSSECTSFRYFEIVAVQMKTFWKLLKLLYTSYNIPNIKDLHRFNLLGALTSATPEKC